MLVCSGSLATAAVACFVFAQMLGSRTPHLYAAVAIGLAGYGCFSLAVGFAVVAVIIVLRA